MKLKQRWSSLLLCAAMLFSLCAPAAAVEDGAGETYIAWTWNGSKLEKSTPQIPADITEITAENVEDLTLDETTGGWYIVRNNDVSYSYGIGVTGTVHLILADGCSLDVYGIRLSENSSLSIYAQSDGETMGKLTARCNDSISAGINVNSGSTITINGGEVTAYGNGGAGIGGYYEKAGGQITINGGTVTATSKGSGAGIGGGGNGGAGGEITITGGTVEATGGGRSADIGGGDGSSDGGSFSTGTNGSAFITALSIADTDSQGSWQGVFFENGILGRVYGNPTLPTDMTIPVGKELNIPSGTSLTIGEGVTLSNNGGISSVGMLEVKGTLENDGIIDSHAYFLNNGTVNSQGSITLDGAFENNGTLNNHGKLTNYDTITNNGTINNIGGTINNQNCKIDNTNGIIISDSEIGGLITGKPAHIHQWEMEWSSNSTHHWHECPDCPLDDSQKDAYADHTFGDWTTDKEATADTAGSKSRTCNICQYTETQTIPATGGGSSGGSSGGSWGGYTPPTYKPDVTQPSQGGGVSVSTSNPKQGDTVTVTPEPDQGYEVDQVAVTGPDGRPVEVKWNPDGSFSFIQPAGKVKIEVTYKAAETPWNNPFADVDGGGWYYEAVRFVQERGLMNGYSDGRFGPNDTLSRAQLAQILFNKEGRPWVNYLMDFSDVPGGAWYTEAIRWAAGQGIVGGYGDGTFGPDDPITREQLAVMLWRYSGSPAANQEMHFADADEISGFALEAVCWAVENGILNGYSDGQLAPQGQATRAQVAQMLKNFIENQEEENT